MSPFECLSEEGDEDGSINLVQIHSICPISMLNKINVKLQYII